MLSLQNDYNTGAHPKVLEKLISTNYEPLPGYGTDRYCSSAAEKIKTFFGCPEAEVCFINGGTQTNQLVISAILKPFEGVISAGTGHVAVHEAGAIEYTGHKVITLPAHEGKMLACELKQYLADFYSDGNNSHMVQPGMVYISFPTEYGTLYSRKELSEIHAVCGEYGIPLYIDGARLCYGLASKENDIVPEEFSSLCDVFYAGGTKCGALCGEAVVFNKGFLPAAIVTQIKQHGALTAKGRLMGVQFDALFTDGLYLEIGRHADELAAKLKEMFVNKGYKVFLDSPTNQQFFIIDNERLKEFGKNVEYSIWEKADADSTVIRLATTWSTNEADLEVLKNYI